jgi:2-C-methyl-D-erythritol 4-phosphate cytidylyltransferase
MLEWSLAALHAVAAVTEIVVALPPGVAAPAGTIGVPGGSQRSHSVRAALAAAAHDDVVIVHDAARPLVTPELVSACLEALGDADAAIAATPVTDTIKECEDGRVVHTLDRSRLWAVQTPQVFRRAALERALAQDDAVVGAATDDASLIEAIGGTVRIVPAPPENLKVTTALDLRVAEMLLGDGLRRGGS